MRFIGVLLIIFFAYLLYPVKDIFSLQQNYVHARKGEFIIQKDKPRKWVSLKSIPKEVQNAIVLSEDWSFYDHSGVDWSQLYLAIKEKLSGTRVRGASTITQQIIKNVFLGPEKTYFRKAHEILLALVAEKVLSKDKLLEIYLNIIHLGENIYGIGSGAYYYFEKRASQLEAKQAAFLAMLLPSPLKNNESFKKKKLTPYGVKIVESILLKLKIDNKISDEYYENLLRKQIIFRGQDTI